MKSFLLQAGMAAATLLLLQAALPAQEVPAAPNPAMVPTAKTPWLDDHREQVLEAEEIGPNLLFIGDSITAGWRQKGLSLWKERYAPYKAANLAIPGDRTQNVLWRLQNGGLGEKIQPRVVVLMIGTNNTETPGQIVEAIAAILSEIQKQVPQAKTLVLDVLPRGDKPDTPGRAKIIAINDLLAKLDDGQKVFFLRIGDKFLEPDGSISPKIMPDFLHPGTAGYQIWADAMEAKLKELLQ